MNRFILRWIINAIALYAAIQLVNRLIPGGILLPDSGSQSGQALNIIVLALIFGLLNALLRPLIMVLTCPLIILTLGLGTLLINTLLFYLTGWLGKLFGESWGFTVSGFLPAFVGAVIVSLVSIGLSLVTGEKQEERRERKSRNY